MKPKERVLLVDDDATTLKLAAHVFQKAGYYVYTASDGFEALDKAETLQPDLAVLDVMMPNMSGLEVCQKLRANPVTAWMPIIMLSAKDGVDDKLNGFQAGADDYVAKPVSHKELLARAAALISRAKRVNQPKARIIAGVGVKGGVGVTTVLVNLAVQLATRGVSAILAELRPTRGTVCHNLNLSPAENLGNILATASGELNSREIVRRLVHHSSGLRVLSGPTRAADYVLSEAHVHTILEALQPQAEYLLLDLPQVAGGGVQLALESADQILLVLEPEAVSVSCARTDLEILKSWGLADRTGLLVVSRARSSNLISVKDVEAELGVPVVTVIPPSPEVFYLAASLGKPAILSKPNSLAAGSVIKLTASLLDQFSVPGVRRV